MRQLSLPGIVEAPVSTLARERANLVARAELLAQTRAANAERAARELGGCRGQVVVRLADARRHG